MNSVLPFYKASDDRYDAALWLDFVTSRRKPEETDLSLTNNKNIYLNVLREDNRLGLRNSRSKQAILQLDILIQNPISQTCWAIGKEWADCGERRDAGRGVGRCFGGGCDSSWRARVIIYISENACWKLAEEGANSAENEAARR